MRKTLFLYIFKDLLRVFLLASGALAGIMSFGGLLRPLTQHNLAMGQVGQMLAYFMPAMTNYSWPIAALFATTFVYGRMSADNELTACRAAGMSYLHILVPAGMLGMIVTLLSAFFLAYVVPRSFLRAEKVVYSNLAQLVAGQIGRTQRISLNSPTQAVTIFARSAEVYERNELEPENQAVELHDVAIVTYANAKAKDEPKIPAEFYLADSAVAKIVMPKDADGDVRITVGMANGERVPRMSDVNKKPLVVASFGTGSAGPFELQSPVRETARFMDIERLLDLRSHPDKSRRILKNLVELAAADQQHAFQQYLYDTIRAGNPIVLSGKENGSAATYTIDPPRPLGGMKPSIGFEKNDITITGGSVDRPGVNFRCEGENANFTGRAREIVLRASPTADDKVIYSKIEVRDAMLLYQDVETALVSRDWNIATPMPASIAEMSKRTAREYLDDVSPSGVERSKKLKSDFVRQRNQIESELHSRFGFAFSCFILAIVGAAIGMLFKSGNFVSAFAVSVGPALISIVLIVTGQHIAESVPKDLGKNFHDPLNFGLWVLWTGNALVTALAGTLYAKLSKT